MDAAYNRKKADEVLQEFYDLRGSNSTTDGPIQMNKVDHDGYMLAKFENPKCWRIVKKKDDGSQERVEAVFRMQGVLCAFDLPPVRRGRETRKDSRKPTNIQHIHLRQSVMITSFGECRDFLDAEWHYFDVLYHIESQFGNALLKFKPGLWEGNPALSFNSRYFTLRRDAPTERGQEFGPGVDPNGVLKELLGQNMVHTADNKVKYSRRVEEEEGARYEPMEPANFKLGDVVEVCFSFYCAPAKGQKIVFAPHLRGLTLLDDTVRKAKPETAQREKKPLLLKRMSWEMLDGEAEEVERRMKKMNIS